MVCAQLSAFALFFVRPAFFQSLPVRLAGFILLLGGVAVLVVTILTRRSVERILVDQAEVQAVLATNAIAEGLDGVMGSVERIARLTARGLEDRTVDAAEAARAARNAMLDQPQICGFGVALSPAADGRGGAAGAAVYRSGGAAKFATVDITAAGREFWERDWYREALETGAPSWSEPFFDAGGTGKNVTRLTAPVWRQTADGREAAGAVFALVELEWLGRLANANEFSDSGYTIVFSRAGRIATHPRRVYVVTETIDTLAEKDNTPELAEMRRRVIARKQGSTRFTEAGGGRRLHANYKPSRAAPGWGIIVAYDEDEFLGPLHDYRKYAAGYLCAGLLVLGAS